MKKAEKQAAKARENQLNGTSNGVELNGKHLNGQHLNGKHLNGERLNGHGGKSAASKMIASESGIFARPRGKPARERQASA